MATTQFHPLTVRQVQHATRDAIAFAPPARTVVRAGRVVAG